MPRAGKKDGIKDRKSKGDGDGPEGLITMVDCGT